jgi:NOL1/NOP2/fmu family ribosome biogenesis protein
MVSNEVIKNRVTVLAENLSKWGSSNVAVTHNDPANFAALPGYFDLVVVDAPCSGSGLFRKNPDTIGEWSEAAVLACSLRQQRILNDIKNSIAHNGYLVYSTCSFSTAENETICDWIIDELQLVPVTIPVPGEWNITNTYSPIHHAPGFRFYPNKVAGEGFFIACFQQPLHPDEISVKPSRLQPPSKEELKIITPWLQDPAALSFFKQKDTIIAFPRHFHEEFTQVQQALHVRKSGVALGVVKGKDFIPHHELALSHFLHHDIPVVQLDKQQAIRYLKRQDILPETKQKGWAVATYEQLALGWIKLLGNRVNNYYPTEWRILKP